MMSHVGVVPVAYVSGLMPNVLLSKAAVLDLSSVGGMVPVNVFDAANGCVGGLCVPGSVPGVVSVKDGVS